MRIVTVQLGPHIHESHNPQDAHHDMSFASSVPSKQMDSSTRFAGQE
jgi:hypothetical protein